MTTYRITVRDVEVPAPHSRSFPTLADALVYFEGMLGYTLETAMLDSFGDPVPTVFALIQLRAMSHGGTIVTWERIGDAEPDPVVASVVEDEPTHADYDDERATVPYVAMPHPMDDPDHPYFPRRLT